MQVFLLRMFTLVSAIFLTLRVQAYWLTDDTFAMFCPVVLWLALGVDRMVQQILHWKRNDRFEHRAWLLPFCLVVVVVSGVTHAPLRVLFWTQKANLEIAEKRLPTQQNFKGDFRPFQIAKSRGDTRFLLWESKPGFSIKTAIGLAHCPNDAGCGRASFYNYWDYSAGTPKYVRNPVDYYWEYSNGAPVYVSLGGNWYATKVSVEDVGD